MDGYNTVHCLQALDMCYVLPLLLNRIDNSSSKQGSDS